MNMKLPGWDYFTKVASLAVAAVTLGFFASCGEITTTPNTSETIPGSADVDSQNVMYGVVTSKSLPLQDVQVSGGAATVATDSAGNYRTYLRAGDSTIVFSKAGYGDVKRTVTAATKTEIKADIAMTANSGGGGDSFTVTPGSYQRVKVTGPGKISFTVVGIDMDLDKDAWPIVYFYDSKGYTGGRGGSGGFNGELRSYKLKYYDASGKIASESYYVQPNGNTPRWSSRVARTVTLEWGSGFVMSTVDGIPFRKPGSVPSTFTLGIGYPPAVRPGWDGAVYTNIVWPAGATKTR